MNDDISMKEGEENDNESYLWLLYECKLWIEQEQRH